MKKFVLVNSPIYKDGTNEIEQYLSPLGLGYIATYLEKADVEVEILDCVKNRISVSEIVNIIKEMRPNYVGINIFTQNYEMVRFIVENISGVCDCFIGGQVVKSIYKELLKWNVNNKLNIIIGEGEFIIPALVSNNCTQQPEEQEGLKFVYRVNEHSMYFPQNISNILLNRKYFQDETIVNHYGQKEIAIITSRGCIYDCSFCGGAKNLNEDIKTRIRSEESVIQEIRKIISVYPDVQSIRILDDLFLRSSNSIDIANNIFCQFPQLSWRGMAHVVSLKSASNKIKELRNGNCKELFIGIESGSELIRKKINKLGTPDDVISVSREILQNGIDLKGYFIYGFPKETREDFQRTYELATTIKEISLNTSGSFRTSVFQFRPYHGTHLYNEIIKETGIIHECQYNEAISQLKKRSQFNFDFGNYSMESNDLLNEYIIKTQKITEEK